MKAHSANIVIIVAFALAIILAGSGCAALGLPGGGGGVPTTQQAETNQENAVRRQARILVKGVVLASDDPMRAAQNAAVDARKIKSALEHALPPDMSLRDLLDQIILKQMGGPRAAIAADLALDIAGEIGIQADISLDVKLSSLVPAQAERVRKLAIVAADSAIETSERLSRLLLGVKVVKLAL